MAVSVIKQNRDNRLVSAILTYDGAKFPANVVPSNQVALIGRNTSNGALYVVYYNTNNQAFYIASTLSGNAPTEGQRIHLQYFTS